MKLIELAIERPVAVLSIVLMTVMLGWLALQTIPIQLTPDARKPLVIVPTNWRGAAPAKVEREIVNRQEDVLKGLEGLERMESRASSGRARIRIECESVRLRRAASSSGTASNPTSRIKSESTNNLSRHLAGRQLPLL